MQLKHLDIVHKTNTRKLLGKENKADHLGIMDLRNDAVVSSLGFLYCLLHLDLKIKKLATWKRQMIQTGGGARRREKV